MEPMVSVQEVELAIGARTILAQANFSVQAGELLGIIGPNGVGKSTLLKALCAMLPLQKGSILLQGEALASMEAKERARRIGYMPQQLDIGFSYTVKEIVMTARYPYLKWWEQERPEDEAVVKSALDYMSVTHLQDKYIQELSGGERQRVMLAKVLAQETDLLLLDEPTAALDLGFADEMFSYCKTLCKTGKTVLVVEHDLERASKFCDRLLLLQQGHIMAIGTPEEVLTEPNLRAAFSMEASVYKDPFYEQLRIYVHKRLGKEAIDA